MANRLDALQSSRRSQCSSASVRTTWVYRPDAIQCLTSIRVSDSRHSYGKTAATVQTMCDPVRTMSSIRQVVHPTFNCPDVSLHGPEARSIRTDPVQPETSCIWKALGKIPELLFGQGKRCPFGRPRLPSGRACQRLRF
jgi:hypothetical protein